MNNAGAGEDAGVGDPGKASAEKGAMYFKAVTEKVAKFFFEVAKADRNDLYS